MTGEQEALISVGDVRLQAEQVPGQLDVFDAIAEQRDAPCRSWPCARCFAREAGQ